MPELALQALERIVAGIFGAVPDSRETGFAPTWRRAHPAWPPDPVGPSKQHVALEECGGHAPFAVAGIRIRSLPFCIGVHAAIRI